MYHYSNTRLEYDFISLFRTRNIDNLNNIIPVHLISKNISIGIHVSDIKDTSLEIHYMESIQSKWLSGLILILLSLILKLSLLVVFGN